MRKKTNIQWRSVRKSGLLDDINLTFESERAFSEYEGSKARQTYFLELVCERLRADPHFRTAVRSELAGIPADRPGRRNVLMDEQIFMLVEIERKCGVTKQVALQRISEIYGLRATTTDRKYWLGKRKMKIERL